jgi:methionyl-tRNA formyltransferase
MSLQPSNKPRVLLVGNGITALTALRSLAAHFRVEAVVRDLDPSVADPVRAFAAENHIPVLALHDLNELTEHVSRLKPDAVVVSSYSRIIPQQVLSLSRFVNVHYSPLPRYRGRANVNWALINGEPNAAISVHLIAPGLDSGNILYQEEIPIGPTDTAGSLYDHLNTIQERELGPAVLRMLNGDAGRPQDSSGATYGCGRIPEDGEIDWRASTAQIDRLVRALGAPFPGAFTFLDCRPLIVLHAAPVINGPVYQGRVPGRVVGRSGAEGWVDVLTGDGILRLKEVALTTGEPCPAASIIKSTRATLGLSTAALLKRIDALEARLASLEQTARPGVSETAF